MAVFNSKGHLVYGATKREQPLCNFGNNNSQTIWLPVTGAQMNTQTTNWGSGGAPSTPSYIYMAGIVAPYRKLTHIGVCVNIDVPSSNIILSVYESSTQDREGYTNVFQSIEPSKRIYLSGLISTASNSIRSEYCNLTVTPGTLYWLGISLSSASLRIAVPTSGGDSLWLVPSLTTNSGEIRPQTPSEGVAFGLTYPFTDRLSPVTQTSIGAAIAGSAILTLWST